MLKCFLDAARRHRSSHADLPSQAAALLATAQICTSPSSHCHLDPRFGCQRTATSSKLETANSSQWLSRQGFAASAVESGDTAARSVEQEDIEVDADLDFRYRVPSEDVWPASKSQRKIASRVHKGLEAAILRMSASGDHLIQSLGFCVEQVRMSPDNMKAFILWSGLPDSEDRLEQTLQTKAGALRMMLANAMRIRRVPRLEFRRNELTDEQQALEEEFERLKQDS